MGVADQYGMRDPADLTDQFNTQLTPEEEAQFQAWLKTLPARLRSTQDYDLRGAWKANAQAAANGHLPDTWKKPNHMTFSAESMYSGPQAQGGQWASANDRNWVYWASPDNLKYRDGGVLGNYFKQYEPDSTLILPYDYRLPGK